MKLIRSVIHPDKVDAVRLALSHANVSWLTFMQVSDINPSKRHTLTWRGRTIEVGAVRTEIDIAVGDDDVDDVVSVILKTARTGDLDDGYVAVMPVEYRYEIRTGRQVLS